MRVEYIVQKEDYKAKITVVVTDYSLSQNIYKILDLSILPKRKRVWKSLTYEIKESYEYYICDRGGRTAYLQQQYLKYVSEEDIMDAANCVYKQLKPEPDKIEIS